MTTVENLIKESEMKVLDMNQVQEVNGGAVVNLVIGMGVGAIAGGYSGYKSGGVKGAIVGGSFGAATGAFGAASAIAKGGLKVAYGVKSLVSAMATNELPGKFQ